MTNGIEHATATTRITADDRREARVFIIDDRTESCAHLAEQIRFFGYDVTAFESAAAALAAARESRPDAAIVDVDLNQEGLAGLDLIEVLCRDVSPAPACIAITEKDDFETRLLAGKAGAVAYVLKPVRPIYLLDVIERHRQDDPDDPIGVLLVDDEASMRELYATVLGQAGIQVQTAGSALEGLTMMTHWDPDVIICDLHMPGCDGFEFAKVVRQYPQRMGTPILFFSVDRSDMSRRYEALIHGGDDFLHKNIDPEWLVKIVRARARRGNEIRSQMHRDGLTGLLKHSVLNDGLAQQLEFAHRNGLVVSFALIDLDNFKQVNDRHGHLVGDKVLVQAARLLTRRLRKSDLIGRYGGEEIGVILPGAASGQSARLLDRLREEFRMLDLLPDADAPPITFSAGVAAFPDYLTPGDMVEAADRALYKAKKTGKDRVVVAGALAGGRS